MTAFVRMKNKEKPLEQARAYFAYVTVWASGFDAVIRYLAQFGEVELGSVGLQLHPKRLVVN